MYTTYNFKTKKLLKEAVARFNEAASKPAEPGKPFPAPVTYYQPGPFGGNEITNGTIYVEGPHYPEPHKWYAQCEVKNGRIVKVK